MNLVAAPLLVPLGTALLCTVAAAAPRLQRRISSGGAIALLVSALLLVAEVATADRLSLAAGGWPPPFGIELVADRLGASLVLIAALMLSVGLLWQQSDVHAAPDSPVLQPLLNGLVAGVCASFLAADLFNLYVWFEVALICSLGLLGLGGGLRQLDATLKYFALNLVGTLVLLSAIAMLYAVTGQLNFTALGQALPATATAVTTPLLGLLLLAFLIKSAAFPFFAWLPASYHTLPVPVLALFSALLSKVGICALLRTWSGLAVPPQPALIEMLAWIALLSMLIGVLGAAYHWDMRRILAFHSISQVGYMLLAMTLSTGRGLGAAIFFALHHSLVKASLFLAAGVVFRCTGHYDLRRIGGLYASRPVFSAGFLLLALSLVGIPPFSGFWGKYLIVRESLAQGESLYAFVALLVGALTFYSMLKIWLEAFWKPHPDQDWRPGEPARLGPAYVGLAGLVLIVLWLGFLPEGPLAYAMAAARTLQGGIP